MTLKEYYLQQKAIFQPALDALKLDYKLQNYSSRNPAIREKAAAILKDPDFQEVLRRLTAGKTAEQIKAMHNPADLDQHAKGKVDFQKLEDAVRYEKRCASVAAEATLRRKNEGVEPTREEIDKYAAAIRKDQRFQAFMQEKESALRTGADYDKANAALNLEGARNQFLTEMAQKVTEPIPQAAGPDELQPQAVQQNPQPEHIPERILE